MKSFLNFDSEMVLSFCSCLIYLEMLTRRGTLFEEKKKIKERSPFYQESRGTVS